MALGLKVAGLFSNNDAFCKELVNACRKTGERVWRLPLHEDFKEQLKSSVADLKNVGGKWGGAATAAKFLEQFVGSTPWIHLDIAGPSWCDSENSTRDAGGTGCFVRSLVAYVETAAQRSEPEEAELNKKHAFRRGRSGSRRFVGGRASHPNHALTTRAWSRSSQLQVIEKALDRLES